MRFVVFEEGQQKQFVQLIKGHSGKTWPQLAQAVHKSRSSLLAYYGGHSQMPEDVFKRLLKIYSECNFNVQFLEKSNTLRIIKKFPKLNSKLAEFLGTAMGDGYIDDEPYSFVISTHTFLDQGYRAKLKKCFKELFGEELTERTQGNKHYLRIYSKDFTQWLHLTFDFPYGKKKNKLHIPFLIRSNPHLLISFLRGVYDTDGTLCPHHKSGGAILEFSSASTDFREEIAQELENFGFTVCRGKKAVTIYRKDEILRFFSMIRPQNNKHLLKYEMFKSTGQVPLTKHIAPVV